MNMYVSTSALMCLGMCKIQNWYIYSIKTKYDAVPYFNSTLPDKSFHPVDYNADLWTILIYPDLVSCKLTYLEVYIDGHCNV